VQRKAEREGDKGSGETNMRGKANANVNREMEEEMMKEKSSWDAHEANGEESGGEQRRSDEVMEGGKCTEKNTEEEKEKHEQK
jgi:hypothetical protein